MQPLLDRMGDGMLFSVLGGISGIGGLALILVIRKFGMRWRSSREHGMSQPEIRPYRKSDGLVCEKDTGLKQKPALPEFEREIR